MRGPRPKTQNHDHLALGNLASRAGPSIGRHVEITQKNGTVDALRRNAWASGWRTQNARERRQNVTLTFCQRLPNAEGRQKQPGLEPNEGMATAHDAHDFGKQFSLVNRESSSFPFRFFFSVAFRFFPPSFPVFSPSLPPSFPLLSSSLLLSFPFLISLFFSPFFPALPLFYLAVVLFLFSFHFLAAILLSIKKENVALASLKKSPF